MKTKILITVFGLLLSAINICAQIESGSGKTYIWTFNGGELSINGTGALSSVENFNFLREDITYIIIEGISSIEHGAFWDYKNLKTVDIPASVVSIEKQPFSGCYSLTAINVSSDNPNYSSIDGVLFNKNKSTLIRYPGDKTHLSYLIPNSVTSIKDAAFQNYFNLETVKIPNSVTYIECGAFTLCYSLNCINVDPDNLNYSSIDGVLFDKDKSTLINYPRSKLNTSYSIPNSVKKIKKNAFLTCENLTSLTIPNSVISIEEIAFRECISLTDIEVAHDNPNYSSINGVLFNKNKSTLILYPGGKPNSSYSIPNSVIKIESRAFWPCRNLTSITIPASVTIIDDWVLFDDRNNLQTMYCKGSIPPIFPNPPLSLSSWKQIGGISRSIILHVPMGALERYRSAPFWGDWFYNNIQEVQYSVSSKPKQQNQPSRSNELKKDPNFKVK